MSSHNTNRRRSGSSRDHDHYPQQEVQEDFDDQDELFLMKVVAARSSYGNAGDATNHTTGQNSMTTSTASLSTHSRSAHSKSTTTTATSPYHLPSLSSAPLPAVHDNDYDNDDDDNSDDCFVAEGDELEDHFFNWNDGTGHHDPCLMKIVRDRANSATMSYSEQPQPQEQDDLMQQLQQQEEQLIRTKQIIHSGNLKNDDTHYVNDPLAPPAAANDNNNPLEQQEEILLQNNPGVVTVDQSNSAAVPRSSRLDEIVASKMDQALQLSLREAQSRPGAYAETPSSAGGNTHTTHNNNRPHIVPHPYNRNLRSHQQQQQQQPPLDEDEENQQFSHDNDPQDADVELPCHKEEPTELPFIYMKRCIGMMVFLIVALIGLTIVLFINPQGWISSEESQNEAVLLSSDLSPQDLSSFIETLPIVTQQAVLDPTTPQAKALAMIRFHGDGDNTNDNNDNILPLWKQTQRYAVAVLYYSLYQTLPRSNNENNDDECRWLEQPQQRSSPCQSRVYQILNLELPLIQPQEQDKETEFVLRPLPPELGLLSHLEIIQIRGASLTNTNDMNQRSITMEEFLPQEISHLRNLTHLELSNLQLQGTIPKWLNNNNSNEFGKTLEVIDWDYNALTGTIPSEFYQAFPNLQQLRLDENQLSGSIATEVGLLTQLQYLTLGGNQDLTGTLPTELAQLTELVELRLRDNLFSGTVNELGSEYLEFLDIRNNDITGSIPTSLCITVLSLNVGRVLCDNIRCCPQQS